jgi:hypothetical protein
MERIGIVMHAEQQKRLYEQLETIWAYLPNNIAQIEMLNLLQMLRQGQNDPALWDLVKRWKYTPPTRHLQNLGVSGTPEKCDISDKPVNPDHLPKADCGT